MTDLFEEVRRHCTYELARVEDALDAMPEYAGENERAWAIRKIFTSNGGGFGWGAGGEEQIEIEARGIRLYRLINGTSGDTQTVEFIGWVQLLHMLDKRDIFTETSAGQIQFRI